MTPDLDALERLALAATPGHVFTVSLIDQTDHCHYCHLPPGDHDAMRVAPATILSLIATTRRLEAALRMVAAEGWWVNWGPGASKALDAARAALAPGHGDHPKDSYRYDGRPGCAALAPQEPGQVN